MMAIAEIYYQLGLLESELIDRISNEKFPYPNWDEWIQYYLDDLNNN